MSKKQLDDKSLINKSFEDLSEDTQALLKELDITIEDPHFIDKVKKAEELCEARGDKIAAYRLQRINNYYEKLIDEMGGVGTTSILENELARRAAFLALLAAEEEEKALANGNESGFDSIDLTGYLNILKVQMQIYKTLVIERNKMLDSKESDGPKNLQEYLMKNRLSGERK